jgi:hypothetical protein
MTWSEHLPLQWTDFNRVPTEGTTVVAVTASGISFGFSAQTTKTQLLDYTAFVDAHFYPDKSWYIKERTNQVILNHERLHFDITEFYTRKFKQRIAQAKFDLRINAQMERIHNAINDELRQMQQKYDTETDHSQNVDKQKEWQQYIKIELEKLAYYK